jgi:hypothetical protein
MTAPDSQDTQDYYWHFGQQRVSESVARRFRVVQWLVVAQVLGVFALTIWVTIR